MFVFEFIHIMDEKLFALISKKIKHPGDSISNLCISNDENSYFVKGLEPSQSLSVMTSPWSFAKWGVDFIDPLSRGRGSTTFTIVVIDYFMKWVEAKPLAKIIEANTTRFLWKNIKCKFGIPREFFIFKKCYFCVTVCIYIYSLDEVAIPI